jgi:hypothetical protein
MQYFIGTVVINDHASRREYSSKALFAAEKEVVAQQLLKDWSQDWDSDGEPDSSGGFIYSRGDASYVVLPYSLVEISPASFFDLVRHMPSFGDVKTGNLEEESAPEQVKTMARRLDAQLSKHGINIPTGTMLNALAASLGFTGWQVLKHGNTEESSKPEEPSTPTGAALPFEGYANLNAGIPGTGKLYRVPVSVDTSMTALVLVRGEDAEDAMETAMHHVAAGHATLTEDEGIYRGTSDFYISDNTKDGVFEVEAPRYVYGSWNHFFGFGNSFQRDCRFVFDRKDGVVTHLDILDGVKGWVSTSKDQKLDLEDSLKNANSEALETPTEWELHEAEALPVWARGT